MKHYRQYVAYVAEQIEGTTEPVGTAALNFVLDDKTDYLYREAMEEVANSAMFAAHVMGAYRNHGYGGRLYDDAHKCVQQGEATYFTPICEAFAQMVSVDVLIHFDQTVALHTA